MNYKREKFKVPVGNKRWTTVSALSCLMFKDKMHIRYRKTFVCNGDSIDIVYFKNATKGMYGLYDYIDFRHNHDISDDDFNYISEYPRIKKGFRFYDRANNCYYAYIGINIYLKYTPNDSKFNMVYVKRDSNWEELFLDSNLDYIDEIIKGEQ